MPRSVGLEEAQLIRELRIVTLLALICRHRVMSLPSMTVPSATMVVGPAYGVNAMPVCCHPVVAAFGNAPEGDEVLDGLDDVVNVGDVVGRVVVGVGVGGLVEDVLDGGLVVVEVELGGTVVVSLGGSVGDGSLSPAGLHTGST